MARQLSKKYMNLNAAQEVHGLSALDLCYPDASFVYAASGDLSRVQFDDGRWVDFGYDNLGRVTEVKVYWSDGRLQYRYQYIYNSEGTVTRQILEQ